MPTLPLQVVPSDGKTPLTPAQQRFNTLVRQVAQSRETLAAWQAGIQTFRSAYAQRVAPLEAQFDGARRQWALALDALTRQDGWSRTELDTMSELIRDLVFGLLIGTPDDAALRALFVEHAGTDFAVALAARRRQATSPEVEPAKDAPRAGQADGQSDADADATPYEEVPTSERDAHTRPRRRTPAERRRDAEAQQATQSVRDVYRKLASALHPDREPDAAQRETKTTLMQQVNRAHEAGDLLALLELQWQVAQFDLQGLAGANTQRLKQYSAVLTEQLASLKASVTEVEQSFRREFGLSPEVSLHPAKLEAVVRALRAELHETVTAFKRDRAQLADPAWVRQWLKYQRRRPGDGAEGIDAR